MLPNLPVDPVQKRAAVVTYGLPSNCAWRAQRACSHAFSALSGLATRSLQRIFAHAQTHRKPAMHEILPAINLVPAGVFNEA